MGNVNRVDKTLKLNEMIYYVRKDAVLRDRWQSDLRSLCDEFEITDEEYAALVSRDPAVLMDIGVHQYLVPHIMRLFYGTSGMTNSHPALLAYLKAFPQESEAALRNTPWEHILDDNG